MARARLTSHPRDRWRPRPRRRSGSHRACTPGRSRGPDVPRDSDGAVLPRRSRRRPSVAHPTDVLLPRPVLRRWSSPEDRRLRPTRSNPVTAAFIILSFVVVIYVGGKLGARTGGAHVAASLSCRDRRRDRSLEFLRPAVECEVHRPQEGAALRGENAKARAGRDEPKRRRRPMP